METEHSDGYRLKAGCYASTIHRTEKLEKLAADGGVGFDGQAAKRLFETLSVGL
jgi:hypothetical protein